MGRELQKRKNRSGVQKVRRKPKSKKLHLGNSIIAQHWDKTQTLEQNYKKLGLAVKLNKHTGGIERKAEDVIRAREEAEQGGQSRKNDALAIASLRKATKLDITEAKIERDPETGKILRVIDAGESKPNPLNDPLNELDSDEDDDEAFNQHASAPYVAGEGGRSAVVQELEQEASKPTAKRKMKQSENERAFVAELVKKHGDDFAAMARDIKANVMQRSAGDLKRRVKKWREDAATEESQQLPSSVTDLVKWDMESCNTAFTPPQPKTQSATKNVNKNECRLLLLPAELRNRIYELAIVDPNPVTIKTSPKTLDGQQPPLTRTSRQLRSEALPIFYGSNTFRFCGGVHDEPFDEQCGSTVGLVALHVDKMKAIELAFCGHGNRYKLDLTKGLTAYDLTMDVAGPDAALVCFVKPGTLRLGKKVLDGEIARYALTELNAGTLVKVIESLQVL